MADHSDSDSSPKSSSSSSASSSSARRRSPPRVRAHSDEGGSSDGVLVELPSQDARSPGADPDAGIFVSMPADDATSGETFEDAPDDLTTARSLDESIAVIDFPDESSSAAECRKYKEERDVCAREAAALRRMLQELVGQEVSSLHADDPDERAPLHSMLDDCSRLVLELNSAARSREQEVDSLRARAVEVEVSKEVVDAYLGSWRQVSELAIGRMVASVDAVVGKDAISFEGVDQDGISVVERKTLLLTERYRQVLLGIEQLEQVLAEVKPGFVAMGQCDHATILGNVSEELVSSKRNEANFMQKLNSFVEENKILTEELEKMKAARDIANAEAGKTKAEIEQMEHKLSTTKEKLTLAVTKGKSLVQHRDSLKQTLAEKSGELERCMVELQQRSDALQESEGRLEELKMLLDEKSAEHEKCLDELRETYNAWEAAKASIEQLNDVNTTLTISDGFLQRIGEVMSEATFPEDLLSLEMIDRLEWLVEQKKIADMVFLEHRKVKDILGSVDFPHSVLAGELDTQITWLVNSLNQAKDDAVRMQNESSEILHRLSAHESKLVSMHEEIDRLTIVLLEEKQAKDILVNELSELMSVYNGAVDKLSVISSQNTELVKAFAEVSDVKWEDNEPLETTKLVDQCASSIQRRAKSSPIECESLEKLQTLVYTLHQELTLCKLILEEDMTDRSERMRLSGELQKMTEAIYVLKNEKDSLRKEFEKVDEKSSLLREKLSMAVKKGKGLVQEREGLKRVLDEKNSEIEKLRHAIDEKISETENVKHALDRNSSEIEKLKHALDEKNSELEKLRQALDVNNSETENLKQALDENNSISDKLKRDLEARNTEMENLKYEIVSRESANTDLREQVENLSSQVTHFDKLQLDIISLSEEKGKVDNMLEEAKVSLGILVDSVSSVALPVDHPSEDPVKKISQIAQYIMESQVAKNHVENELQRAHEQVTLQAGRLSDSYSTIKILEDELSKLNEYISSTFEEKYQMQLRTAAVEEELEKTNEELAHNANKLEDANATINSLQHALSQARTDVAILSAEKNEAGAKHEMETSALNAKLAKYLEELDKSHGNLQSYSTEHHGYLEKLSTLVMDDSMMSLMAEEFGKKVSTLRDMSLTVKGMHEHLGAMGFQIDPIMEDSEFGKLFSLQDYNNFVTERMLDRKSRKENIGDDSSLSNIVEQCSNQAGHFSGFFKDISGYMSDNIILLLRALQLASSNFARTLEEHDSLKIELENKDAQNRAREDELLSLQKELRAMSSKCIYCTEQIQIIFDGLLDLGYAIDLATGNSSIVSKVGQTLSVLKNEESGDYIKVVDTLVSSVNKLKSESQKLSDIKGLVITLIEELKMRLKQAESAAETASNDHQLYLERVHKLEEDLRTAYDERNGMEIRIQEYQEREDALKARELELLSLEQTTVERGTTDAISKDQLEALVEKVSKLNIPSGESHLQREVAMFSSPMDKVFFVIDEFDALQREAETLSYENEDLQLNLESHAREIEQLKEVCRNIDSNRRELESKSSELLEVTVSMERMIQRFGYLAGKDPLEDNKPASTQTLLPKLEKLIIASSMESGNAKSVKQELGSKLQAREKTVDELSAKVKMLEDLYHSQLVQPEVSKDRAFDASSSAIGSDISEIEDLGPMGKASVSSVPTAAHARVMRKGSSDHLVLNMGSESERLIAAHDSDDKGRIKSLHTSGLIPAQGKHIADRLDGIWVSGSQILMNRPRARLGLLAYWLFLHLWLVGSIL
ncbi:trans-Golgi network-localized SYP41-interacting protein 1 [Triticum urartu]|uniref:Uncharacterized protein n=1 Tax=Triticum urartu TaxID=4572 RepID=A0A8R7UWF9_TRIUA|nr:trans-Golgi network-localized SYP41-interacting protein 1 [Triticum urartu]